MPDKDAIELLQDKIIAFRDARNWKQFHNPKDLAISIALEAAELLEVYQWSGTNLDVVNRIDAVKEELADILIYALLMAKDLNLNVFQMITDKLALNDKKYPVKKAYGKSDKYSVLDNN